MKTLKNNILFIFSGVIISLIICVISLITAVPPQVVCPENIYNSEVENLKMSIERMSNKITSCTFEAEEYRARWIACMDAQHD
jgi:hypothetical protein